MSKNTKEKRKKNRWLMFFTVGFFILLFLIFGFLLFLNFYYQNKIFPGVQIGGINLSGKTRKEALVDLKKSSDYLMREGLFFKYKDKEVVVSSALISTGDIDLSREIFSIDLEKSVEKAFTIGRNKNFFQNTKERVVSFLKKKDYPINYYLNEKELRDALHKNFSDLEKPGNDAYFKIIFKNKKPEIKIISEKLGRTFDYDLAILKAKNNISFLKNDPIKMYIKTDYPKIKKEDIALLIPKIKNILNRKDISLTINCSVDKDLQEYCPNNNDLEIKKIDKKLIASWIGYEPGSNYIRLVLNREKVKNFLENLNKKIAKPAQDARFKMKDGRVVEFYSGKNGIKIDIKRTVDEIDNIFFDSNVLNVDIYITRDLAKNSIEDINDLGIKELVGKGESDFSGSPKNRRHNIKTGADSLNGLLIKPGEEFSLVKNLGEIDAEHGYLQELVIKGNKTVPEYGGGLCQIATTMFRLALNTGLPITERHPHAYRVVYYEPAGTDATIYIPKPDLKFINDTDHYLLLQTKIEGNKLIFSFWGTDDGRKVEISKPKIYNIVPPGPTKIIETEDLKPGEKKCTESSHNGADAEFKRIIIYKNGEKKEERWFSRYRPWQAVCLIGKEKEDLDENGENKEKSGEKEENDEAVNVENVENKTN